jgi:FkbM family methyltransferase
VETTGSKIETTLAQKRRKRAREETDQLLTPLVEALCPRYLDGVIQCGLGDWAEGPVLNQLFTGAKFMAVEPIQRYALEAWQAGFRGPIVQGVLWNKTGKVFHIEDFRTKTSMLDKEKRRGKFSAMSYTLDDAVKFVGYELEWRDHLLWMDVEGVELEILKGAKKTLERTVAIVCEVKDKPRIKGWPPTEVVEKFITDLGFVKWHRISDNSLFVRPGVECPLSLQKSP